jgi:malate dehydrogenase (oxaloacetate-decarboxylating)(NADP+)
MTETRKAGELPRGIDLLHDPLLNKSTAFSEAERDAFGLRGLLPPRIFSMAEQQRRVMENFARKESDLERYIFLAALQDRNETLFYRTLVDHLVQLLPIIYTPTVGEACRRFGHIFRRPRGLYVSANDRGRVLQLLRNWPESDVRVIVVTDGERVLGMGDLGAYGMGIPIGKLSLYTACGGIHPRHCLPVMLDVGTDNVELLDDPLYIGLVQRRVRGAEYVELVEEFVTAVEQIFPRALIQFEDFATANAISLLARYRDRACTFNDDIQGTAAVVLAGLIASGRISGRRLADERLLFLGAGSAATGIASLIVAAMVEEGLSVEQATDRCWLVDVHGLVVAGRPELPAYQRPFARPESRPSDFLSALDACRPTALVGASGQAGGFSEMVLRSMAAMHERPVILALSNPTTHSECTAEQAYGWTGGRGIFASGSPFGPVMVAGRAMVPAQANNAYIFPGIGLGATLSGARHITDAMFASAARRLAALVTDEELGTGAILPPLSAIRDVSAEIAVAVMEAARRDGLATVAFPSDPGRFVREVMYQPIYPDYLEKDAFAGG